MASSIVISEHFDEIMDILGLIGHLLNTLDHKIHPKILLNSVYNANMMATTKKIWKL